MSAFGASRNTATAPEKGVFPLDHGGECKSIMKEILACFKKEKNDHFACKHLSKAYLECRMDKGLMQSEDLAKLGFSSKDIDVEQERKLRYQNNKAGEKEARGFTAGRERRKKDGLLFFGTGKAVKEESKEETNAN